MFFQVSVVKFPGYSISTLYIDRVRKTTDYECKASNPSGSDSKIIAVKAPPKPYLTFLREPSGKIT